ncbi:alpha/beta fold hydrolase [Rhodoferax sp. PAMC 29310]|uniref:alpha/beta fold hydrolase n=1 Tax=Rhodoferax sp. PAMC 29310 TaxID=2822760 RepID=UPI001B3340A2|nr:alpha/beta hydrolase [Rhodoferax sp. PAMC 29310]
MSQTASASVLHPVLAGLGFLLLSACASISSPQERAQLADQLSQSRGWQSQRLHVGPFQLVSYGPKRIVPDEALTVYIEGDGFSWISGSQPSLDPTPIDPLALRLALAQPAGHAVYLARPCQYVGASLPGCDSRYWTNWRFAPEVIEATRRAVNELKQQHGAQRLTLVGYSGGGAVAALVAVGRHDVQSLVTVAGNLDHRAWTTMQRIDPLAGSLNPADASSALQGVAQWHWVGGRDRVVPLSVAQSYAARFPATQRPLVLVEAANDHRCCWVQDWPRLWSGMARVNDE